ncbi:MAG: DUF3566 domain-containing protein [Acidimicrobiales bacterium]
MPPEEPGAPSPGPPDAGSTATFRAGAEPAEATRPPQSDPARPSAQPPEGTSPRPDDPVRPPAEPPGTGTGTGDQGEGDPPRKPAPPRRRFLDDPDPDQPKAPRAPKVRARKVHRVVRHIEPWSVLKVSVLFFTSIFLIICVASALLWNAGRSAGVIDDVESFITSLGFGNCEDIQGDDAPDTSSTETTISGGGAQVGAGTSTTATVAEQPQDERSTIPDEEGKCGEGQRLVGGFKFEDARIFESFALGGIVLVLSGAAFSVVMALLFNLISDLTGGVRVTVLHEEPDGPRRRPTAEGTADRGTSS